MVLLARKASKSSKSPVFPNSTGQPKHQHVLAFFFSFLSALRNRAGWVPFRYQLLSGVRPRVGHRALERAAGRQLALRRPYTGERGLRVRVTGREDALHHLGQLRRLMPLKAGCFWRNLLSPVWTKLLQRATRCMSCERVLH